MKISKLEFVTILLAAIFLAFTAGWFLGGSRQAESVRVETQRTLRQTEPIAAPAPTAVDDPLSRGEKININTADVARAINALLEAELAKEKQNTVVDTIEEVYTKGLDAAEQLGIEREDIENAVDSVANVAKEKVNELKDKAIEKAKEKGKEAIDEVINELVN